MSVEKMIEDMDFHESSLIGFEQYKNIITLNFKNIYVGDELKYCATVILDGVQKILCDDVAVRNVSMIASYGHVVEFNRSGNMALLIVNWFTRTPRFEKTHAYRFDFANFTLRAERQPEDER